MKVLLRVRSRHVWGLSLFFLAPDDVIPKVSQLSRRACTVLINLLADWHFVLSRDYLLVVALCLLAKIDITIALMATVVFCSSLMACVTLWGSRSCRVRAQWPVVGHGWFPYQRSLFPRYAYMWPFESVCCWGLGDVTPKVSQLFSRVCMCW